MSQQDNNKNIYTVYKDFRILFQQCHTIRVFFQRSEENTVVKSCKLIFLNLISGNVTSKECCAEVLHKF